MQSYAYAHVELLSPLPLACYKTKQCGRGGAGPACTKAAAGGGPAYQLSSPATTVAPARRLHSESHVAGPYGPTPPSYKYPHYSPHFASTHLKLSQLTGQKQSPHAPPSPEAG